MWFRQMTTQQWHANMTIGKQALSLKKQEYAAITLADSYQYTNIAYAARATLAAIEEWRNALGQYENNDAANAYRVAALGLYGALVIAGESDRAREVSDAIRTLFVFIA